MRGGFVPILSHGHGLHLGCRGPSASNHLGAGNRSAIARENARVPRLKSVHVHGLKGHGDLEVGAAVRKRVVAWVVLLLDKSYRDELAAE